MPQRLIPFMDSEIYHVYNRGSRKQPIFLDDRDSHRFQLLLEFYSYSGHRLRYSYFNRLSIDEQLEYLKRLRSEKNRLVEILCYCLMPNHYHLLIKQQSENGISTFMRILQNSYTRYFNTKYQEVGPLIQGQFKAVHIDNDSQLLHVSRYIHLNPYSSYVVKTLKDLEQYKFSSLNEYLSGNSSLSQTKLILSYFTQKANYRDFVFNRADYQRTLEEIKHLMID